MDNIQLTPPIPRKNMSLGVKLLLLGLQCALLMIGAFAIWIMSDDRDRQNTNVADVIVSDGGGLVYINGPRIKEHLDSSKWICPATFNCEANVETKSHHRNIYEAEVFTATVNLTGSFRKDSLLNFGDTIYFELGVTTKQIAKLSALIVSGKTFNWSKSDYLLFAKVNIADMPEIIDFSTAFDIHGAASLFIKQIGNNFSDHY